MSIYIKRRTDMPDRTKSLTIIVFSNDMDRAMASFTIATGAASAGIKVTMFFTFWGLSLLRKKNGSNSAKTVIERMFGWLLPRGPKETRLSKMNFFGAGTTMMKGVMRKKHIASLEELMDMAVSLGVNLVACTTTMEMMGIPQEEMREGIAIGGVMTYLGSAQESQINLFI
jgi:peroxiredoxin family protein